MRAVAVLAGAVVAGAGAWFLWGGQAESFGQPKTVNIEAGRALYQENCAACHGADLEGQVEDWRSPGEDGLLPAPPHDETGHTWHHGDMLLFNYTRLGGKETLARQGLEFQSGMPGFGDSLSDQEIWDIIDYIKSTWPRRVQEMQAVRTEAERQQQGQQ
ncbi:c-type cytochrome [Aliiruegeria lutimaris]|uniref:Cytochrome c, mono-and diheme variants n=1 Tax=Aliiruegeria lutimaris TaxID=571298 RepID=A0A1G9LU13_9RHOB|nr:cytochrome c [Aliiruegeria lutimaris]SDL65231.1 Cytochrome c, mono-and diheme variants [Aliiruegeria lutimaris]